MSSVKGKVRKAQSSLFSQALCFPCFSCTKLANNGQLNGLLNSAPLVRSPAGRSSMAFHLLRKKRLFHLLRCDVTVTTWQRHWCRFCALAAGSEVPVCGASSHFALLPCKSSSWFQCNWQLIALAILLILPSLRNSPFSLPHVPFTVHSTKIHPAWRFRWSWMPLFWGTRPEGLHQHAAQSRV